VAIQKKPSIRLDGHGSLAACLAMTILTITLFFKIVKKAADANS